MSNTDTNLQYEPGFKESTNMTPLHIPCVCIPHTHDTEWGFVKDRFEKVFGLHCVKRVDIISKRNKKNKMYNCVFVHFNKWPENPTAQGVRQKLMNGESIKLIYDFPWYWKCYASRNTRR